MIPYGFDAFSAEFGGRGGLMHIAYCIGLWSCCTIRQISDSILRDVITLYSPSNSYMNLRSVNAWL